MAWISQAGDRHAEAVDIIVIAIIYQMLSIYACFEDGTGCSIPQVAYYLRLRNMCRCRTPTSSHSKSALELWSTLYSAGTSAVLGWIPLYLVVFFLGDPVGEWGLDPNHYSKHSPFRGVGS